MKYEIMLILDPKQTEKGIEKSLEEVKKFMAEHEFVVVDQDVWGHRDLAYKIKGRATGYYVIMHFTGEPEGSIGLRRDLGLQTSILRMLLIKVDDNAVLVHYDNTPEAGKQKLSKHAEELSKKVTGQTKKKPVEAEAEVEVEVEEADLDEKLQAFIDDTDIDV